MKAKEIMTKDVITVTEATSIQEAIDLLIEKVITGLIVVDKHDKVIGVVTEKDLIVAYDFLSETTSPIGDFTSKDVISAAEDTPIEEIGKILVQRNIKRVPILKENKVTGIVSRRDILENIRDTHK